MNEKTDRHRRQNRLLAINRIFVLADGAIVGAGTHAQLLESCPIYREIYLSQTGGEAA